MSELRAEFNLGAGIPTGRVVQYIAFNLCDGERSTLAISDGGLLLEDDLRKTWDSRIAVPEEGHPLDIFSNTDWTVYPAGAGVLPDSRASFGADGLSAWLVRPTDIYGHGILGDRIEASAFRIRGLWPNKPELTLPPDSVFEDLRVRMVDLTGDGREEFVVIRSYLDRGAALAVYHLVDGRIEHLAETPAIGTSNRWLNPAGAADFDGDGRVEIAYVETPHIGGTLRVWELVDGELRQEQAVAGFSNHAIGSRELDLSAVLDWNADGVPDLAVPANGRRSLRIVTFAGGTFAQLDAIRHDAEIVTAILATDLDADGKPELLYGLEDGRLMLARP